MSVVIEWIILLGLFSGISYLQKWNNIATFKAQATNINHISHALQVLDNSVKKDFIQNALF